ncbi:hypothetical protein [Kutzneria sp. NPDC051319]|uniref:hypothetical protein n=1 Tax=Kutzneria sp. NPDC051319 TaxID=3155047 RepID=UPI0034263C2D
MDANEFRSKPPDVKVPPPLAPPKDRQAEVAEARTKFGLDGGREAPRTGVDRRPVVERPPEAQHRSAPEGSPLRESEKTLAQKGFTPKDIDGLRQTLRDNPQLCDTLATSKTNAEMLHDFSRIGTVPDQRFAVSKSPEVDALVHRAVDKQPGEYVSQRDLDGLMKIVGGSDPTLLRQGFSGSDIDRIRNYLVVETGRVVPSELPQAVMTDDGVEHKTTADGVLHDRWRMVDATAKNPLSTGVARAAGADLKTVEHVSQAATLIQEPVGKYVKRTGEVRKGIDAASKPPQ